MVNLKKISQNRGSVPYSYGVEDESDEVLVFAPSFDVLCKVELGAGENER